VVVEGHDLGGGLVGHLSLDGVLVLVRSPEVADEALVLRLHKVEGLVESLFLGKEHLVDVDGRAGVAVDGVSVDGVEFHQLLSQELSGVLVDGLVVLDGVLHPLHLHVEVGSTGQVVELSSERLTESLDLVSDDASVLEGHDVD